MILFESALAVRRLDLDVFFLLDMGVSLIWMVLSLPNIKDQYADERGKTRIWIVFDG